MKSIINQKVAKRVIHGVIKFHTCRFNIGMCSFSKTIVQ